MLPTLLELMVPGGLGLMCPSVLSHMGFHRTEQNRTVQCFGATPALTPVPSPVHLHPALPTEEPCAALNFQIVDKHTAEIVHANSCKNQRRKEDGNMARCGVLPTQADISVALKE